MIIVAENINVMSKSLGPAMKNRDKKPIQKMVETIIKNGADYLDLNIGPARKGGVELIQWLVKTVHEVTDKPLFIDTTNIEAIEAGLRSCNEAGVKAVINSISAVSERMDKLLPMVKKYDCEMVALLYGPDGIPRDENERGAMAAELLFRAQNEGIENSRMWFDPIVVPVSSQQVQVVFCTNFTGMISDIAPDAKSTCGLSNVSNGAPNKLRPILNQIYLCMLRHNKLTSAILDGLDNEIIAIAKDDNHPMQKFVDKLMDGQITDPSALSEEEIRYYKTYKVLNNETLYSDSWLEL